MFAVKGWSLPAAPVAQTEASGLPVGKRGKKRKRQHEHGSRDEVNKVSETSKSVGEDEISVEAGKRASGRSQGGSKKRRLNESHDKAQGQADDGQLSEDSAHIDGDPNVGKESGRNDSGDSQKIREQLLAQFERINQSLEEEARGDGKMSTKKKLRLRNQKQQLERRLHLINAEMRKGTTSKSKKPQQSATPKLTSAQSTMSNANHTRPSSDPATKNNATTTEWHNGTSENAKSALTPLQLSMRAKLASARFRHLNEQLYTSSSSAVQKVFTADPQMFEDYHLGFRLQVESWPENPVDSLVDDVRRRAATGSDSVRKKREAETASAVGSALPLPRTKGVCTIADLGAGEGRLTLRLKELGIGVGRDKVTGKVFSGNVRVVSYDLVGKEGVVIAADIADLPLKDGTVDVAVACLALMGTNWLDFVDEAWRVLRVKGELWVAEIKSRFGRVDRAKATAAKTHKVAKKTKRPLETYPAGQDEELLEPEVDKGNKDQTDVSAFLEVLRKRGFVLDQRADQAVDSSNKMFVKMRFVKAGTPTKGKNATMGASKPVLEKGVVKKGGRWLDDSMEEEVDESKVLKPCVYKLR